MTILDGLRAQAMIWVRNATLEQLGKLPGEVIGFTTETVFEADKPAKTGRRRRIPKKVRHNMTKHDGDMIRKAMAGLAPKSPAYVKKRSELAREHGFTARQIGSAFSGVDRAARRKAGTIKK